LYKVNVSMQNSPKYGPQKIKKKNKVPIGVLILSISVSHKHRISIITARVVHVKLETILKENPIAYLQRRLINQLFYLTVPKFKLTFKASQLKKAS